MPNGGDYKSCDRLIISSERNNSLTQSKDTDKMKKNDIATIVSKNGPAFLAWCAARKVNLDDGDATKAARKAFAHELTAKAEGKSTHERKTVQVALFGVSKDGARSLLETKTCAARDRKEFAQTMVLRATHERGTKEYTSFAAAIVSQIA